MLDPEMLELLANIVIIAPACDCPPMKELPDPVPTIVKVLSTTTAPLYVPLDT